MEKTFPAHGGHERPSGGTPSRRRSVVRAKPAPGCGDSCHLFPALCPRAQPEQSGKERKSASDGHRTRTLSLCAGGATFTLASWAGLLAAGPGTATTLHRRRGGRRGRPGCGGSASGGSLSPPLTSAAHRARTLHKAVCAERLSAFWGLGGWCVPGRSAHVTSPHESPGLQVSAELSGRRFTCRQHTGGRDSACPYDATGSASVPFPGFDGVLSLS